MATNVIEGKNGDVKIGATSMQVTEWSANITADELETTNKASGGWQDFTLGVFRLEGSFTADWDRDIPSSGTPPYATVVPQTGISFTLEIGDDSTNGESTLTFTGMISGLDISSATDGKITYTSTFKSTGAVTHTVNS